MCNELENIDTSDCSETDLNNINLIKNICNDPERSVFDRDVPKLPQCIENNTTFKNNMCEVLKNLNTDTCSEKDNAFILLMQLFGGCLTKEEIDKLEREGKLSMGTPKQQVQEFSDYNKSEQKKYEVTGFISTSLGFGIINY